MECIEARALKSSFLSQMGMKTNYPHHMFCNDDVWCINSVPSDDFPVEELLNLDFSEKEFQEGLISLSREDEEQVPNKESSIHSSSSTFSGADEIDSLSELAVPVDDLENLEWLSQFVDDSSTGLSLPHPAESFKPVPNSGKRVDPVNRAPFFPVPVPVKARTTRSRKPSGRPWTLPSPAPLASGDSSSTPSSSHGSSTLTPFVFVKTVNDAEWFSSIEKPVAKKHKRKAEPETGSGRRCTHCQVQKTPQWRTGPSGPKTLCNACGVRYKSGRLFPEYRPAFSPTFSQELHSNSHRKVLEMRRRKETGVAVETVQMVEVGLTRLVQSS